ncbi:MAG: DNA alkylation repair protein [Tissierellia bacterium]|nr:DNA alkylation repair protein [Tissierellia bacterium]
MDKLDNIKKAFENNRDDNNAELMSKYMRNLFSFYGIKTPTRRAIYKELLKEEKKSKVIDWIFLNKCWNEEQREFQYLVIDYLTGMKKHLVCDDMKYLRAYAKSKQWWDTIDGLDKIIGSIAFTDSRINDLMLEWSVDEDFWLRRIAIDHQLGRKEKTDTELLEQILVNNFGSNEFFINKAIGWSLREYSKTDSKWVRDFVKRHYEKMDKLSIREASKYI